MGLARGKTGYKSSVGRPDRRLSVKVLVSGVINQVSVCIIVEKARKSPFPRVIDFEASMKASLEAPCPIVYHFSAVQMLYMAESWH
jgi:hypothetical protein